VEPVRAHVLPARALTSTRLLARNSALNVFGLVAPLAAAFVAGPILISALGSPRFGVLTLVWAFIGYFSLFDFGIGRALTQAASEAIGAEDTDRLRRVTGSALAGMTVLGLLGTVVVIAVAPLLAFSILKMDATLRPEAARSFYILSLSLPFVVVTTGLRGLLEAHQHFGAVTALRLPYSLFNFLGPLAILPFSRSLIPIVMALAIGRVILFVAHLAVCLARYPWLRKAWPPDLTTFRPLMRMGGWMTVSNVINPLMIYADRFLVGAMLSLTAVAYYVTPFEVVVRLLVVPGAVLGVFFPAFAATYAKQPERTTAMFDRALRFMLFTMFPAVLAITTFAGEGLRLWVGLDYANHSTWVAIWLAAGVLINSLGQVPQGLMQAINRADLTAKLHLAELPVYAALILVLTPRYGVAGVAAAWTLRVVMDTAVVCLMVRKHFTPALPAIDRSIVWLGGLLLALVTVRVPTSAMSRGVTGAVILVTFFLAAWSHLLLEPERELFRRLLGGGGVRSGEGAA
jgi:O-antigen/teichoic acid export membrane protein